LADTGRQASHLVFLVTGCEFSGQPTLLTLAVGEAKSGGGVWGRQKRTWHAEAACGMKCAGALRILFVHPRELQAASASIFSSHFKRLHRSAKLATSYTSDAGASMVKDWADRLWGFWGGTPTSGLYAGRMSAAIAYCEGISLREPRDSGVAGT
jgi:hypothetical protein